MAPFKAVWTVPLTLVLIHVHLNSTFSFNSLGGQDSDYSYYRSIVTSRTSITSIYSQSFWYSFEIRRRVADHDQIIRSTGAAESSRTKAKRQSAEHGYAEWEEQWANCWRGKQQLCCSCYGLNAMNAAFHAIGTISWLTNTNRTVSQPRGT